MKVITSSQVPQQQAQDIPQTPRHKRQLPVEQLLTTPQNRRDFDKLIGLLPESVNTQRSVRMVLRKASKAIDQFHHHHVIQSQTLTAYELQLQEQKNKKKRKVTIDVNESFATLERIMATKAVVALEQPVWDEQRAAQEAKKVSNQLLAIQIAACTHELHISDVVV